MTLTRRLCRGGATFHLSAALPFLVLFLLATSDALYAQDATRPLPVPSGLKIPATGDAGMVARMLGKPGPMQPLAWKVPQGARVEVATANGYVADKTPDNVFALEVGKVYRFRVSNIATLPGAEIYPTIELIGRLNPPLGKAWEFPIEASLPIGDIEAALNGALITRVVFLEDAANAANVDTSEDPERLTLDVPQGIDPVAAASTRGKPVAIIRLGSRVPDGEPNESDPFFFGLPRVEFNPNVAKAPETTEPLTPSDAQALSDPANVK